MAFRRAIGAVKDQTRIGLAKVGSSGSIADLEVAIVKATRHEECPPEERHIREILSLTCYSQSYITECINSIARRLSKTKNWVVALKTLMLMRRILTEGDPAYEQEIFFTTKQGTRLLNMSDFRDTSRSNSWDFSAFVRTYALYLDERLEYRMQGKRKKLNKCTYSSEDNEDEESSSTATSPSRNDVVNDLKFDEILFKLHHLQQVLDRFLATKPAGLARHHHLITVALYPIVKESFHIYYDTTELLTVLIDLFKNLEIQDCVKVHEIFFRVSKQFNELDAYYAWCKEVALARASECPEVEKITPKKLELMDEFIRERIADERSKLPIMDIEEKIIVETSSPEGERENEDDMNQMKALPPPENEEEKTEHEEKEERKEVPESGEADLLHLGDDAPTTEDYGERLALALFDGTGGPMQEGPSPPPSAWEAYKDQSDWETALVQSVSYLPHQKTDLGGGFNTLVLDGMYRQATANAAMEANHVEGSGSASSVALGSIGNPHLLALPAPPSSFGSFSGYVDPFTASLGQAPPPYVQMSDMEKKQRLLVEEQLMWQQYQMNGMQGRPPP